MQTVHDPSTSSYYVNEQLYRDLVASFTDWQRDDLAVHDPSERDQFRMLVERKLACSTSLLRRMAGDVFARMHLLGAGNAGRGDPRREIAISFDDRRRMEDRIYRLRTGYAWSQAPKSRTVRMISNVETFATDQSTIRMVRSNFLISEFRVDGTRFLSGWCGHRLVRAAHALGHPGPTGQPDRLRPEPAQSQHCALTPRSMSRPPPRMISARMCGWSSPPRP